MTGKYCNNPTISKYHTSWCCFVQLWPCTVTVKMTPLIPSLLSEVNRAPILLNLMIIIINIFKQAS